MQQLKPDCKTMYDGMADYTSSQQQVQQMIEEQLKMKFAGVDNDLLALDQRVGNAKAEIKTKFGELELAIKQLEGKVQGQNPGFQIGAGYVDDKVNQVIKEFAQLKSLTETLKDRLDQLENGTGGVKPHPLSRPPSPGGLVATTGDTSSPSPPVSGLVGSTGVATSGGGV